MEGLDSARMDEIKIDEVLGFSERDLKGRLSSANNLLIFHHFGR